MSKVSAHLEKVHSHLAEHHSNLAECFGKLADFGKSAKSEMEGGKDLTDCLGKIATQHVAVEQRPPKRARGPRRASRGVGDDEVEVRISDAARETWQGGE